MDIRLGKQLGNYRLIRLLGQGDFSEVYLAEQVFLNTLVAIKVLRAHLRHEAIEDFRSQVRLVAQLEHPHILRFLDFGMEGATPFLVMPYAPHGTLADRHRRGTGLPLSLAEIFLYLQPVGAALQYAHQQQVIHRNVKPQTIFVGRHNDLLLGDFGIALLVENAEVVDDQKAALSSVYAAPELLEGRAVFASDQYSLAMCVYEWLCGELPFQGDPLHWQYQQKREPLPPLSGKVPTVSPALDAVVLKALAYEPEDRFPTLAAFLEAFERTCRSEQSTIQIGPSKQEPEQSGDHRSRDRVGQHFGYYRLTRFLGHGAFAEVYLAEHVHLQTEAAVKVLATRFTAEERERFRREAQTIARLEHPSIIRLLEYGVEDRIPFLVMKYAAKGTLRQRHPKGTHLSPTTIVPYVKQIAAALQYAHDQQLIHRDIKPDNLLVGRNDEVLLSDFGLAVIAQSTYSSQLLDVAGTASYMAPEQIQGKPGLASDQYALAVVVYEWLCGEQPFRGSLFEVYSQHLFTPPRPLREKVPTLSSQIEHVVMKALSKDPQQRFATVEAFANALASATSR